MIRIPCEQHDSRRRALLMEITDAQWECIALI